MLIITAKVLRRKLAFSVAAAALLCCAALVMTLIPPAARQTAAAGPDIKRVKTNQDRVAYLQYFGWQVSEQPTAVEELLIPREFDGSYAEYLALQSSQGFDLERCAGKRVKRYSYEVLNYPTGESGVIANLLIHKNSVIGGEVLSPRLDGFLHGLSMP